MELGKYVFGLFFFFFLFFFLLPILVLRSFVPGIGLVAKILSHRESWNFGWLYLLISCLVRAPLGILLVGVEESSAILLVGVEESSALEEINGDRLRLHESPNGVRQGREARFLR